MKKEYVIDLHSLTSLNSFILDVQQFCCDVDAIYGKYTVDAKSYLGVASISTHPITVRINSGEKEVLQEFHDFCKKYIYEGEI